MAKLQVQLYFSNLDLEPVGEEGREEEGEIHR